MSQFADLAKLDRAVVIRYHEIALKGDNRGWFESRLIGNSQKILQRALGRPVGILRQHGRVVILEPWNEATREGLSRVFGISTYSPIRIVPTSMDSLIQNSLEEFRTFVASHPFPKSFRVFTRRSEKALPESSMQIDMQVGSALHDAYPALAVDLDKPDFTLGIEVRHEKSYIWTQKFRGPHGLPVGTNGHLLSLLSGGLDSPVAAIQALKRGSTTSFIHFYGAPFVGAEVLEKVEDLVRLVNRYQPDGQPLHVVPFGKIQETIALATNPKMRTILYRRMMMRVSSMLARKLNAQALVTGESLGQVASQTLENIAAVDAAATLPILRPLITFDKDEIIEQAKRWDTFSTSVRPAADCCTLFADRHPILKATQEIIEEQEARFPVAELAEQALAGIELRAAL